MIHGVPKSKTATLEGYLEKNEDKNKVYLSNKKTVNNKTIKTKYTLIATKSNLSLIEVELITGRTHQIRAHMAYIGHPLVGDGKYGVNKADREKGYKYQALYSYKLKFNFTSEEKTALDYLNGKEFKIDKRDIYFTKEYFK